MSDVDVMRPFRREISAGCPLPFSFFLFVYIIVSSVIFLSFPHQSTPTPLPRTLPFDFDLLRPPERSRLAGDVTFGDGPSLGCLVSVFLRACSTCNVYISPASLRTSARVHFCRSKTFLLMCLPFLRVINEASQCNLHLFTRTIFMRGAQACCGRLGVEGKQQHSSTMQSAHSLWDEKWLSEDTLLFVGSRKLAIASSIGSTATVSAEERGQVTSSNAMPSIEEMCLLSAAAPTTTTTTAPQDFLARDMEELVSEIKENLRLSSGGLKSRPTFSVLHKSSRPSPYRIPSRSRSWGDPSCDACLKAGSSCSGHSYKKATKAAAESDDPYEMLQELLRDGGLIKEAVRRLNMGLSPKQRYFYDSDEDTRSPLRVCHVEL